MKKHATRSILIDPNAKTITEIMLPRIGDIDFLRKLIGCDCCDHVDYGPGLKMAIDDVGLYNITREAVPPHNVTQGFFVTLHNGEPGRFISGKGVLWAYNDEGETDDLPAWITPELVRQHVAFVADHHRNAAANLCEEILSQAGVAFEPEQIRLHQRRYADIVRRAMALTI